MSSEYGKNIRISVFGQSHGRAIGVNIDGLPAGERIDPEELAAFMARRAPGRGPLTTARSETDEPVFLSGIENGVTTGFPVCAIIENRDVRSGDYDAFADTPRPGHADYTARIRYGGFADMRGGGHFSGRLTAPLCIAGGVIRQILARRGIYAGAHLLSVGDACDEPFPLMPDAALFSRIAEGDMPVVDPGAGDRMRRVIETVRAAGDSVGGVIECAVIGLPAGLGSPLFGGVENVIAAAVFGVPAVKGVEFGAGFRAAAMRGSEHNDPFVVENGAIGTATNNAGGVLGGITDGMPVVFRAAVKPTPSIALPQRTVNTRELTEAEISVKGRHDPCVAVRAVPAIEAAAAIAVYDLLLDGGAIKKDERERSS